MNIITIQTKMIHTSIVACRGLLHLIETIRLKVVIRPIHFTSSTIFRLKLGKKFDIIHFVYSKEYVLWVYGLSGIPELLEV